MRNFNEFSKKKRNIIIVVIITILVLFIPLFINRASFGRFMKDVKSEWGNGLERSVEVYDVNGNLIKKYEGKFDIEYDSDRIRFDDENGKRHVIYYKTGTIIVDEK